MTEQTLSGKTALVTGGASGLGKAIATKYLEAGANVVICDIHDERLQQTSVELSTKGTLKAIKINVANQNEVESLFEQMIKEFGKIDILVNNAGIIDKFDPVGDLDPELWNRVMAINLTAPFLLSKLAVRNMLAQPVPDGRIINIVSVAGQAGWAAGAAYTASKHGVVGLTKNTAAFYGTKGIRCNALMMGGMHTNIFESMQSGLNVEGFQKAAAIREAIGVPLCEVDTAAELCLNLTAGKGFGIVNGACIAADNGWTSIP
ncbi:Glucose/ribitol dehydrogenase [Penicillium angulare]|uniref:Glucose/ribitol dehydrogenase n=1 Tax=Penicillium angulare TaxID=116970 RepID=A0A9W9KK44_9EURO|nr:Glucose/ribitol dehydrogenase [Penicillium angulare]